VTKQRKRPSLGRSKAVRELDQFDTPPIALAPLFAHEPLLAGVKAICEPFCGLGNLVTDMRARGIVVHASDIQDRSCPESIVLDFLAMTQRPDNCDVLVSNPPFNIALECIEHAWHLGFRLVILLMEPSFMHSAERFERLHPRGHLRRIYPLAERLKDMHDAAYLAKGGKKKSQPRMHAWYVFDRNFYGDATTIPISIKDPTARMPWHNPAAQLIRMLNGDSLTNPPDGGEVRQPDTKPWVVLGISRATWYRQGKPKQESQTHKGSYYRQKSLARSYDDCSVRSIQRQSFVRRYGIPEIGELAWQKILPFGMLENIAKLEHDDQRRFVAQLRELAIALPPQRYWKGTAEAARKSFGPVMGPIFRADPLELKRAAQLVYSSILTELFHGLAAE
jgi:hypothetical protein